MIKENLRMLNRLNVLLDGVIVFISLPLAFWLRFFLLPGGEIAVPFRYYLYLALLLVPVYLIIFASFGLYEPARKKREMNRLLFACLLGMVLTLTILFLFKEIHFSRLALVFYFLLSTGGFGIKRSLLRNLLAYYRRKGYNQKSVLIVGDSPLSRQYRDVITSDRELGYRAIGYIAARPAPDRKEDAYLGHYGELEAALDRFCPDEVVAALPAEDVSLTPAVIEACEKAGVKLSIIPFYAEYMPSNPQFDDVSGIPLINIRRIPLDNWGNAFLKRTMDIIGALILTVLTSPLMLIAAVGVKLSSPGPIIFRQKRVGRNKKIFYMYKFRSMRMNGKQETGWSTDRDDRKTRFGALIRKCSIDELPQFFNVLKGDMSLVGPRPEVPYFVDQFKKEIPLYMVKHQVRPGITGWAQVNGLRGDTPIKARVEHDIFYIENWSLVFDLKILVLTLFKGIINNEKLRT